MNEGWRHVMNHRPPRINGELLAGASGILRPNLDDGHHPSRATSFLAVRKEDVGAARRAVICHMDVGGGDAGPAQLIAGNRDQVKVQGGYGIRPVAWRLLGKEKERVPAGDRFLDLIVRSHAKEIFTIRVPAGKRDHDFIAHFIATRTNRGSDRRHQITRIGTEDANHLPDGDLYNASECSSPSGVNGGHRAAARVGQENGHAIRTSYGKGNAGFLSEEGVTLRQSIASATRDWITGRPIFELAARAAHYLVHCCRVNLPELGERGSPGA